MFDLIIDNGRCENIIGTHTVDKLKLKLPLEPHPEPYKIWWIKSIGEISVNQQCRVPFSIEQYRDEMYYDMIDMDACSLIFGRPRQYVVNTKHLGRDNLYKIRKNGVNYTLVPLKKESNPKTSKVEVRAFPYNN